MAHHPFGDLPHWLEETNALIVPATLWNEDCDNPSELDGYRAFFPNGLDKPDKGFPTVAFVVWRRLRVFLQLDALKPPLQVLHVHP